MKTLNCHYEMYNPNIVSAEGCYVVDESGKKYVDFEAGVWCASVGHNNRRVNEAIIRQLNTVSHVGYRYTAKIVDEAASKVLDLLDFADGKCVFLSSGSEAVEFGVRAAEKVMGKPYFLSLSNFYLSAYGISAARSSEQWISIDISDYCGNPDDFLRNVPFDKIGAFVFEPGNASGTVKLPPIELIHAIEGRIKENDAFIIVNEVTAGIGRTGKFFGHQHYNIRPDIVACGKGIGNGYPVSVAAMSNRIVKAVESSGFRYAQSHQDDPMGCAVVKEVLSVIEDNDYIQHAAMMGTVLELELRTLQDKHKCIKQVRGVGLMYVIEFFRDENYPLEKIHRALFDAGYIAGTNAAANVLRFYPPLIIEEAQIKDMAKALDEVLSRIKM